MREDTVRLGRSDFASEGIDALQARVAPGAAPMKNETALRAVTPLVEQPVADRPKGLMSPPSGTAWWQHGIIYEIYLRSFMDSNGDGVGDLQGLRRRLDYLVWLGVDAIWITPMYPSPMADGGYDISELAVASTRFSETWSTSIVC